MSRTIVYERASNPEPLQEGEWRGYIWRRPGAGFLDIRYTWGVFDREPPEREYAYEAAQGDAGMAFSRWGARLSCRKAMALLRAKAADDHKPIEVVRDRG